MMTSQSQAKEKLHHVTSVVTEPEDNVKFYDEWAETFDENQISSGYNGPVKSASILSSYLPNTDARILDFACGTGRVAGELSKLGYRNIDGLDASQKSLDVAARKDIMNELICVWVDDKTIKIASDCYDGLICVGGFVPGHLHSDCFDEWIRIVKPGGVIVNVLRQQWLDEYEPYANNQLEDDMKQKERSMKWELIQRGNFDGGDQQWKMAVFIHKVL
ncbi:methyltransferase-like protein 27 isoform X1 [Antedon mediterranea]|uniref:methyltransferase-like protein 27 isoform X1 n=1 Tax=Antedon mediterranea TaxID=105859 RepID=UPI003AF5D84F